METHLNKPKKIMAGLASVALIFSLYLAFFYAPADAVQGEVQRIMYLHVPMVWTGFIAVFVLFIASCLYLYERAPRWDNLADSSAELATLFIGVGIATGSIWGRPTWGIWWTWDARLTTTAILFFMLIIYRMLRSYIQDQDQRARVTAILGIIATLDIPLIHVSVLWWRTLHQPPTLLNPSGPPPIAAPMKWTLLANVGAWTLVYFYLLSRKLYLKRLEAHAQAST